MFTIVKADRHKFTVKRPFDYGFIVLRRIMLASVPLAYIYYIIDCWVRSG
jgi:hypothetical protein